MLATSATGWEWKPKGNLKSNVANTASSPKQTIGKLTHCSQQVIYINSQISSPFQQNLNYLYNLLWPRSNLQYARRNMLHLKIQLGTCWNIHCLDHSLPRNEGSCCRKKHLVQGMLSDKSRLVLKHYGHVLCNRNSFSGFNVLILHILIEQKLRCTLLQICAFHVIASCLPKAETHDQLYG